MSATLLRELVKYITCPACKNMQGMVYAPESSLWFPVSPYCCETMQYRDTLEWNQLLDIALNKINWSIT
jgi:hypothetical protein